MNFRQLRRRSILVTGLGATLSLSMMLGLTGCGSEPNTTDKAVVLVQDPLSVSGAKSAAAPATSDKTAEPAKTEAAPAAAPAAAAATAAGWGTLKGRVVFEGTVPAPKVLVAKGGDKDTKDAAFCAKEEIDSERLVVNAKGNGVKNILVYIPKPTSVSPEALSAYKATPVEFDQKNCKFIPHIMAAMAKSTITIKSSDAVGHNVNTSGGLNNNKYNLPTQPLSSMPLVLRGPDKPGKVTCDIHNWMEGYWLILDNPYFAVTDADGNFEIKNVPAGDQKVVVWAEAAGPGYLTAASGDTFSIKAGGETTKEIKFDASKVK